MRYGKDILGTELFYLNQSACLYWAPVIYGVSLDPETLEPHSKFLRMRYYWLTFLIYWLKVIICKAFHIVGPSLNIISRGTHLMVYFIFLVMHPQWFPSACTACTSTLAFLAFQMLYTISPESFVRLRLFLSLL